MEHHLSVAKIVGSATDSSWAQAYSAGKLHIVLSLEGGEKALAATGKETLEKLQREFFALDEKTLESITKVVSTVFEGISPELTTSLLLTTVVEDVLYIVSAHSGFAILHRSNKTTIIASGEKNAVSSFSGKILPGDVIIIATHKTLETLSLEKIKDSLKNATPGEIAETLAPAIHEHSNGSEAALIWKVGGVVARETQEEDTDENPQELEKESTRRKLPAISLKRPAFPKISVKKLNRKSIAILASLLLIFVLVVGFFMQKMKAADSKNQATLEKILTSEKQKYEDALAVMELNRGMGMQDLSQVKDDVEKNLNQLPEGSKQRKELQMFLDEVNKALGGSTQTSSKIKLLYDGSKNSEISSVTYISFKGGELIGVGNKKGGIIKSDGSISSSFDVESPKSITSDEKNAYVISGNSVIQIGKSSGKSSTIIEKQDNPISIGTFGGNIYLLSQTDKTVYKYRPNDFNKEAYFTSDTKLSNPSSLAIDSSVYVVDNGGVKKYTRGNQDTFSFKGKTLSSSSQIYTDEEYTNVYIIDPEKKNATITDKSGNVVSEISLNGMKKITSVTSDEENKKLYIASDGNIYSIDF